MTLSSQKLRSSAIALFITLCAAGAQADECSQRLAFSTVERLQSSLQKSVENLSQLQDGLMQEEKAMLASRSLDGWNTLDTELNLVGSVLLSAERFQNHMDKVLLLAQLKEVMVSDRDKQNVGKLLSVFAGRISLYSSDTNVAINDRLVRLQRPAVVIDAYSGDRDR